MFIVNWLYGLYWIATLRSKISYRYGHLQTCGGAHVALGYLVLGVLPLLVGLRGGSQVTPSK